MILICIYLAADDGDCLSMCLLPICISCSVKCLLISFSDLQIDLFFLMLSFDNSLYILDISPFSNIFSHSVALLFHRTKILNFNKVQFIKFSFYGGYFVIKSNLLVLEFEDFLIFSESFIVMSYI